MAPGAVQALTHVEIAGGVVARVYRTIGATMHAPREQNGIEAGHTVPQAPQFIALDCVSTQVSPQRVVPAGQAHTPAVQGTDPGHTVPQAPQCMVLVCVLTQVSPQFVCPVGHTHMPPAQGTVPRHTLPHAPQLFRSVVMLVQVPPQRSLPVGQGATHMPPAQMRSPAQALPHRPQWLLSACVLVHTAPQKRLGGAHPPSTVERGWQAPATHTWPPVQARPHMPQLPGST